MSARGSRERAGVGPPRGCTCAGPASGDLRTHEHHHRGRARTPTQAPSLPMWPSRGARPPVPGGGVCRSPAHVGTNVMHARRNAAPRCSPTACRDPPCARAAVRASPRPNEMRMRSRGHSGAAVPTARAHDDVGPRQVFPNRATRTCARPGGDRGVPLSLWGPGRCDRRESVIWKQVELNLSIQEGYESTNTNEQHEWNLFQLS
jgi:hypothetical protein